MTETEQQATGKAFLVDLATVLLGADTPESGLLGALRMVAQRYGADHARLYERGEHATTTLVHHGESGGESGFPDEMLNEELDQRDPMRNGGGVLLLGLTHQGRGVGALALGPRLLRPPAPEVAALLGSGLHRHIQDRRQHGVEHELLGFARATGDIVFVVDARNGRGLYVNEAYERITGRSSQQWARYVGVADPSVHPEDYASVQATLSEYLETVRSRGVHSAGTCRWQSRLRRVDGTYVWVETDLFVTADSAGRLARLYGVCRDIEHRHGIEAELAHLLDRTQRDRDDQVAAVRKFVHDLRGPLAAVVALLDGGLTAHDPEQVMQMFAHAGEAAHEVVELFEARVVPLLHPARNPEPEMTAPVRALLRQTVELSGVVVEVPDVAAGVRVAGDHLQVRRALTLMLAAHRPPPRLEVAVGAQQVTFVIVSSGTAWSEIAPAADRAGELLARNHGSITLEDDGTCRIQLRRVDREPPGNVGLGGLRVLVVDDHEWTTEVVRATLVEAGGVVDTATSAAEMWDLLSRSAFDVVVLDRNLPDAVAEDVLRELGLLPVPPRVLVLTADVFEGARERMVAAGADGFLSKPFTTATLVGAVAEVLQPRGSGPADP